MNPIRIAWVPPSGNNLNRASYRLECWYPHLWLSQNGFESTVLDEFPTKADKNKFDFLIWFRTDCNDRAFESGIPVIFFLTDGPLPSINQLAQSIWMVTDCDMVHDTLSAMKLGHKATFIHDTFDPPTPEEMARFKLAKMRRDRPKLVWVGSQGGYPWASAAIDHLRHRWEVEVISDHASATKPWSRDTVFSDIMDCDIGIIPYPLGLKFDDNRGFQPLAKDINRVVLLQAAGLPVIAAPLPAYLNYIRNGVDGMIADGPEEFDMCVSVLAQNPVAMGTMANLGWLRAWTTASSPFTGNKWRQLLNKLGGR